MKLGVVDSNAYWTEQLFQRCGRFAEVLLVKPRDFRAHRQQTGSYLSDAEPREIGNRVFELRMSMPPGWFVALRAWSEWQIIRRLRAFAQGHPLTLVVTFPQYRGLIRSLRPSGSVYYNLDDYRDNWAQHTDRIPDWERETVEAADVTICIANYRTNLLREQHPAKARAIYHLPLGVTPEFMGRAAAQHASGPRGVAGYVGALNYRFDFGFIASVAALLPDVDFVLGGRVQEDGDAAWRFGLSEARRQPNIKFLGWVDHARLPEQFATFDVLLMAYAACNFNTNACPAKLWDYLGTGKPIVANTANPETLLWQEVIRIGASPAEYTEAVRAALGERDEAPRKRRLAIAQEHTWDKLSERLEKILLAAPTNH